MSFSRSTYQKEKDKAFREFEEEMSLGQMPEVVTTIKVTWISARAIGLIESEEYDDAVMLMHEAIDLDYTNPISRTTLAKIYRVLGQHEKSYNTLEKNFKDIVARLSSIFEEFEFYLEVGYASYYMNKKKQALSVFKKALNAVTNKSKSPSDAESAEFLKKLGADFQRPEITEGELENLREIIQAIEFQLL